MKRIVCLLLVLLLPLAALAAPVQPLVKNEKLNTKTMKTIHGEDVSITNPAMLVGASDLGLVYLLPTQYSDQTFASQLTWMYDGSSLTMSYLPNSQLENLSKLASAQDNLEHLKLLSEMESKTLYLMCVVPLHQDDPGAQKAEARFAERFEKQELLADDGQTRYLLYYNSAPTSADVTPEEAASLAQAVATCVPLIKSSLMLFPGKDLSQGTGQGQASVDHLAMEGILEGQDMEGKDFGKKELSQYDLTVVNIWATTCYPCIAELPQFQKLYEQLPPHVNLISVCLDGREESELAQAILKQTGVQFTTLAGDELAKTVLKNIISTPTTIFLDTQGQPVGPAITGVIDNADWFVDTCLELIQQRLSLIRGQ